MNHETDDLPEAKAPLTELISAARRGEEGAERRLFDVIYDEVRRVAQRNRYVGRDGQTMQATVLANEVYLRCAERFPMPPTDQIESRQTFFRTVAQVMREIMRDHWRRSHALKRGGDRARIPVDPVRLPVAADDDLDTTDFLAIDDALDKLQSYNQRWWDVVMHRYFGGRTVEETAELLGVSPRTVKNDTSLSRAWLRRELGAGGSGT